MKKKKGFHPNKGHLMGPSACNYTSTHSPEWQALTLSGSIKMVNNSKIFLANTQLW